jgi:two-component system response regulator DevR
MGIFPRCSNQAISSQRHPATTWFDSPNVPKPDDKGFQRIGTDAPGRGRIRPWEVSFLTEKQATPVRIMIVDDHEVVRVGLRCIFERVPDFHTVAEAATAEQAVRVVEQLAAQRKAGRKQKDAALGVPDVIVMDVRMPGGSGVDACRTIRSRFPQVKVIMLTSYSDDEAILASVMAGAAGYVLKQIGSDELVHAIRTVHDGGSLLDPETTKKLLEHVRAGQIPGMESAAGAESDEFGFATDGLASSIITDLPEPISEQEQRILSLIAEGKTNREIAERIYLSEKTVRNYVSNILGKLNLSNRAQAAAFAVRHGIASPRRY